LAGVAQARAARRGRSHSAARGHDRRQRRHRVAVGSGSAPQVNPPAFNLRLTPSFENVGRAGWNVVIEENGSYGGGTGIGVIHPSMPFVSVSGSSEGGSHLWTTVAVTLPEVSAVVVEGKTRVATEALPGLPYGLRAARVVTPFEEPHSFPGPLLGGQRGIPPIAALGANGEALPQASTRETREDPVQGTVHRWSRANGPARGSCQLHASGGAGLVAERGATLSDIRPYPGQIFADAFLVCSATLYSLDGHQLRAYVLLDAAHPGTAPAMIPGLEPVPGAPGIYGGNSGYYGGPTNLIARRAGEGWVAVQGAGPAERTQLLEELSATIDL